MEYGSSRRRLRPAQLAPIQHRRRNQIHRKIHRSRSSCYEGFAGFRSWGYCYSCLEANQSARGTPTEEVVHIGHIPRPSSCMVVFPITIAPASCHCCTHHDVASLPCLKSSLVPRVRLYPVMCTSSLTATGTPSRGPSGWPFLYRSVEASAAARIISTCDSRKAVECFPAGVTSRRTRGSKVSTTASGVSSPEEYKAW